MSNKLGMKGALRTRMFKTIRSVPLGWKLRNSLRWPYLRGQVAYHLGLPLSGLLGHVSAIGSLYALVKHADGTQVNYGLLGRRSVTTAFCAFVVDQLQTETSVFGDFKFHDSGVGTTAENITDTTIETTDGEGRATGTQTESSSVAYRSVGTISYTTTKAITEHGLFNDATTGTLMDRTVFSAINVVDGDSIQFTFTLTVTAGG